MDSDAVVNSVGAGLTRRIVGRYDESFMPSPAQMFEYTQH